MSFKRYVIHSLDPKEKYFWNSLEDPRDKLPWEQNFSQSAYKPRYMKISEVTKYVRKI